jgi:hypothetical protein
LRGHIDGQDVSEARQGLMMARIGFEELAERISKHADYQNAKDEDEQAMVIAIETISDYGSDLTPEEFQLVMKERKIWRDYPAYQAALAGLRLGMIIGRTKS